MPVTVALLSASASASEKDREEAFANGFINIDDRTVLLSGDAASIRSMYSDQCVSHYLYPPGREIFHKLVIGQSVRLFWNAWAIALVAHYMIALRSGGKFYIPVVSGREAVAKGYWSLDRIEKLVGNQNCRQSGDKYVEVCRVEEFERPPSILDWFFENVAEVVLEDHLGTFACDSSSYEHYRDYLDPVEYGSERSYAEPESGTYKGEPNLLESLRQQFYYIGGMSSKTAIFEYILEKEIGTGKNLKICDQGGGYGLLALEMLLSPNLDVEKAVCVDISQKNQAISRRLFDYYGDRIRNRFFFHRVSFKDYKFNEAFDSVSYIGGTLLYITRSEARQAVERAWDSLKPNGVLIVQENVRHPRFTRDYDLMFEAGELDQLMKGFGEIRCYMSTATKAMQPRVVGEKTVYRVVQKP